MKLNTKKEVYIQPVSFYVMDFILRIRLAITVPMPVAPYLILSQGVQYYSIEGQAVQT